MTCDPRSITCNNGVSFSESEVVYPRSATSSVAVCHAFGADRLRGEVGPERTKEVREGVRQHVDNDQGAEELGASRRIAKADTDQHFQGDQDGDEDDGNERVDLNEQLRGQLEVVETHDRTVIRS